MKKYGIDYEWKNNTIKIEHQKYIPVNITVEADWSAASYWYLMAAFSDKVDVVLKGLNKNSLQGDSIVEKYFRSFNINTEYIKDGIHITKNNNVIPERLDFNLTNTPDIAQTLVVTLSLLNIPFTISGIKNLKIKETDRIKALQNELLKFNISITETEPGKIEFKKTEFLNSQNISISTYNDHRMALSFAPAALLLKEIIIEKPDVVDKSYPCFLEDLKKVGFEILQV